MRVHYFSKNVGLCLGVESKGQSGNNGLFMKYSQSSRVRQGNEQSSSCLHWNFPDYPPNVSL